MAAPVRRRHRAHPGHRLAEEPAGRPQGWPITRRQGRAIQERAFVSCGTPNAGSANAIITPLINPERRKVSVMVRALTLSSCVAAALFVAVVALQGQQATWQPPDEQGQGQTPVMPVHQEPHHRQLFQSGPMRIIDLQIPPGDVSWFHSHEWPVFYLTVADSQTRTQVLGLEWGARARGAGPGRAGPPAGAAPGAGAGAVPAAPPAAPAAPPAAAAPRAGGAGRGF